MTKHIKTCVLCGKDFEVRPYRKDTAHYCSKKCWSSRRTPNIKTCKNCEKPFDAIDKRSVYCSVECSQAHMRGEYAAAYKHGESNRDRAKQSYELRKWRKSVFSRDNYQCVKCGNKGHLHAHHIKSWANHIESRFDVDNGETLCEACHGLIHGKNFATRRIKKCVSCGKKTTGRGIKGMCKSCSIQESHAKKRLPKQG